VRARPAFGEQGFAHLGRYGQIGYVIAVDVPNLALTVAERHGVEPAGL
jgi:hypothetical protein